MNFVKYLNLRKYDPDFNFAPDEKEWIEFKFFANNKERCSVFIAIHNSGRVVASISLFTNDLGQVFCEPNSVYGYFRNDSEAIIFYCAYMLSKKIFSEDGEICILNCLKAKLDPSLF